jgi:hypothetical protein
MPVANSHANKISASPRSWKTTQQTNSKIPYIIIGIILIGISAAALHYFDIVKL